jgi:uncharacterized protein YjbI with pentapeptide repeats
MLLKIQWMRRFTLFYAIYVKDCRYSGRSARRKIKRVFTAYEKQYLGGRIFRESQLNYLDFSAADLRDTRFESVLLYGCDFSGADLRGTAFLDCDLRGACFGRAVFGNNSFKGSWLTGAQDISCLLFEYIRARGGHFAYC